MTILAAATIAIWGCGPKPDPEYIPEDPVEREAVLGLYRGYRNTAMYEMKDVRILSVVPMIPTESFVEEHDPQELYCVCAEYWARYKVPWTTEDHSPWLRTIRNILVIQTQGGHFLSLKPSGICPEHCL
jgi:hypothetical protein